MKKITALGILSLSSLIVLSGCISQGEDIAMKASENTIENNNDSTRVDDKMTNSDTTANISDKRKKFSLLDNKNLSEEERCFVEFNQNEPNQQKEYRSEEWGVKFNIPYNPSWGNDLYRIDAHEELSGNEHEGSLARIYYGSISGYEACTWTREYVVNVLPQKDVKEVVSSVYARNDLLQGEAVIEEKIGSLNTVKYVTGGLAGRYEIIQVVGNKYNYEFFPILGNFSEEELEKMKNVIKSIELIGGSE